MSYTIIRVEKITNVGSLVASLDHNHRSRPCPRAIPTMTMYNEILVGEDTPTDMAHHREIIEPLTRQRNSVLALEYVVACPPEAIEALDGPQGASNGNYLKNAAKWVSERHGGPHTVVSAVIHRDEDSPHLHVIVVPIVKTKRRGGHEHQILSAKHYVGGKEKLRALQTDFTNDVGSKFGLERGISRELTGRRHRPVREWDAPRALSLEIDRLGLSSHTRDELETIIVLQRQSVKAAGGNFVDGELRLPIQRVVVEKPIDRIISVPVDVREKYMTPADELDDSMRAYLVQKDGDLGPRGAAAAVSLAKIAGFDAANGYKAVRFLSDRIQRDGSIKTLSGAIDHTIFQIEGLLDREDKIADTLKKLREPEIGQEPNRGMTR